MRKISVIIILAMAAVLIGCNKKESVNKPNDNPKVDNTWKNYKISLFEDLRFETERWHKDPLEVLPHFSGNGWEDNADEYEKDGLYTTYSYKSMGGNAKAYVRCYYSDYEDYVTQIRLCYKKDYFTCLSDAKVYHEVVDALTSSFYLYDHKDYYFKDYGFYDEEDGTYFTGYDYSIVANYLDDLVLNNSEWHIKWESEDEDCLCVLWLRNGWVYISFGG